MLIEAISVRNFRSLSSNELISCSTINILIGKNNSGKSNVLSALNIALSHLKKGVMTSEFATPVGPAEEFFQRDTTKNIQIGLQFQLNDTIRNRILTAISEETSGIEVALAASRTEESLTGVIGGMFIAKSLSLYIKEISFGKIIVDEEDIKSDSAIIVSITRSTAFEMINADRSLAAKKTSR